MIDMLQELKDQGDQGSDYNDAVNGYFSWTIHYDGYSKGTLYLRFESVDDRDNPVTEEWKIERLD